MPAKGTDMGDVRFFDPLTLSLSRWERGPFVKGSSIQEASMQPGGIREDKRNAHPWILPRLIQAALHVGKGYGHGGCQVF